VSPPVHVGSREQPDPNPVPVPLPTWDSGQVAVEPPRREPGWWSGAPSAWVDGGTTWLAYRLRAPLGEGRGYQVVVARSADGVRFDPVLALDKASFGAESLERPALLRTPDGTWRLYVSCATPGTKHWWVDLLEAADPADFTPVGRRTVLPGDDRTAVKDPVVRLVAGTWHLWASVHPTQLLEQADRMDTRHATSPDGVSWTWRGTALAARPGQWDGRGVRITAVLPDHGRPIAYYDGRARADQNYEELTGVAVGAGPAPGEFHAVGSGPAVSSPFPPGGLRYLDVVELAGGGHRLYYEGTGFDGAHELRTELLAPPT
jgi:hypothetical protein